MGDDSGSSVDELLVYLSEIDGEILRREGMVGAIQQELDTILDKRDRIRIPELARSGRSRNVLVAESYRKQLNMGVKELERALAEAMEDLRAARDRRALIAAEIEEINSSAESGDEQ